MIELNEKYAEIARKRIADVFRPVWVERPSPVQLALPADWESQDSAGSFSAAIKAIGDDVRSGAPVPTDGYFARKDRA